MVNSIFIAPLLLKFFTSFSAYFFCLHRNACKGQKAFYKKKQHLFYYVKCNTYTFFSSASIRHIKLAHMAFNVCVHVHATHSYPSKKSPANFSVILQTGSAPTIAILHWRRCWSKVQMLSLISSKSQSTYNTDFSAELSIDLIGVFCLQFWDHETWFLRLLHIAWWFVIFQ